MVYRVEKDNVLTDYTQDKRQDVFNLDFPKIVEVVTDWPDDRIREEDILNDALWGNYNF